MKVIRRNSYLLGISVLVLVVFVLASACGDGGQSSAPTAPATGKIAFISLRDGNSEIYVMNADGSGVTRLSSNSASEPAWSPDGSRIAFISARDTGDVRRPDGAAPPTEIYVMNADGSGATRLTDHPAADGSVAWSPDGSRIAFNSDRDGNDEIYVMNSDGSGVTRLTYNPGYDFLSAWSPDGSRIAFVSGRDGNDEIYVMNADGSDQTNLTNNPADDGLDGFAWSPDGSRIAFASDRDGNDEIYVMNADGSDVTRVTNDPGIDIYPAWSPVP